jgi:hypothetical protein
MEMATLWAELPNGIFSNQINKKIFGKISEYLVGEERYVDVGTFYGHLVYFMAILVYFSRFDLLYQK